MSSTDLAVKRTDLAVKRTDLAVKRTDQAGMRTRWAADRTLWASDRTFIAWLRTAISMIGFGIGIGKASDVLTEYGYQGDPGNALQYIGLSLVALGILGMVGALIQEYRITKRLTNAGFGRVEPVPLARAIGFLVILLGTVGGVVIFL